MVHLIRSCRYKIVYVLLGKLAERNSPASSFECCGRALPSQPPQKGRPVTSWRKKIAILPNERETALLPNKLICTL